MIAAPGWGEEEIEAALAPGLRRALAAVPDTPEGHWEHAAALKRVLRARRRDQEERLRLFFQALGADEGA